MIIRLNATTTWSFEIWIKIFKFLKNTRWGKLRKPKNKKVCPNEIPKCEKQAKIHFLWSLNCFFVSVYISKCLEIVENCFQGNLFTTITDTKNTENSKKQFKEDKKWILACFSHLVPVCVVQKNGVKIQKNEICVI